ncbi:dipeptidyl aminopeptidase/acylaminoacyl peptidase [Stackebrandtia endophytica]|uniref:Dipeptidyl aminopeptidase/acylaminoacyl peptidase n=1 Tax=Stackebrandtia endophytica TaxID=1496996 RepID=A0A543AR42_9ACTN|nr:prolyl oligopeptidase family serine peptidase [Stackebrandtia endophytica]TQL75039.1 dipeptidyl aminopeptidase/acylaminoacyl peptidase [Stackebrandtia endophytica]
MNPSVTLADLLGPIRLADVSPHPDGSEVAVVKDPGDGLGLWREQLDGSVASLLPTGSGTPSRCVWRPDGDAILVSVDPLGAENYRLIEVDAGSGETTWCLEAPGARFEFGTPYGSGTQPYSPDSRLIAYSSNQRDPEVFDVMIRDLHTGRTRTVLTGDDRYYPMYWSPDGSRLLIMKVHQNTDHTLYVHDVDTGHNRRITPPGRAKWLPGGWSADGSAVFVSTEYGGDLLGLARLDVGSGDLTWFHRPDNEVVYVAVSPSGNRLAWGVTVDGGSDIYTGGSDGGDVRRLDRAPSGSACEELGLGGGALTFIDEDRLLALVSSATAPPELHLLDTRQDTVRQVTDCARGLEVRNLVEPEAIEYAGHDGLPVQAFMYRPQGASGPVPMVVYLHGGPEHRHANEFDPITQALLGAGIGVFAPNVRGSSGYGSAFQRSVYRDWCGGDIKDVERGVAHLDTLDWVDTNRLGVCGASYGGLATLACLTQLPNLWRCGVDLFGPSDLVMDATLVPPYWRARVKEWIGDVDDPADLDRLRAHSPLTHADRITAPLLVVQGVHDVRVAQRHSDAIVDRLRELDREVEYLLIEEGHGFSSRDNGLKVGTAWVGWLVKYLTT